MAIVISGENGNVGKRFKEFSIEYTVTAETDSEIKVTETLGGNVLRTYTAVSGETQVAIVPVEGLALGQHALTIAAATNGETEERVYTFTVPAVWIDCAETNLGNKTDSFSVVYVPESYSGAELTVTEFLDGEQQREYTTASGDAQSMTIYMRSVADGAHSISVTAACGDDEWTAVFAFVAATLMPHEGGSVQELQDETGAPVFPVTLAKAVTTSIGESVESVAVAVKGLEEWRDTANNVFMRAELLWENASPTSAFVAQTVSVDLTEYDAIVVHYFSTTALDFEKYEMYGKNTSNAWFISIPGWFASGAWHARFRMRGLNTTDNGVQFTAGYMKSIIWSSSDKLNTDNTVNIPYRIYGVRGLSNEVRT